MNGCGRSYAADVDLVEAEWTRSEVAEISLHDAQNRLEELADAA